MPRPMTERECVRWVDDHWRDLDTTQLRNPPAERTPADPMRLEELFAGVVTRQPHAPAVTAGGVTLSYSELDRRANRLGWALRANGADRGRFVALYLPRTVDLVVAMIACLKAGAAYVGIDPTLPSLRSMRLLSDTRPSAVLTVQSAALPPVASLDPSVLVLDGDDVTAPYERTSLPPSHAGGPDDVAYVVHTSGSTGVPKGVLGEHRGVAAHLHQRLVPLLDRVRGSEQLRMLSTYSVSFDGFLEDSLALCLGDHLFLADEAARRDPYELARLIREHDLQTLNCTPTVLRQLTVAGGASDPLPPSVRLVLLAGEPVPPDLWTLLAESHAVAYNKYGPSEVTIDCTAARVRASAAPEIGGPLGDARLYLLDADLRQPAEGEAGEIVVGGTGLTRGYLNQPGQTARAFIPDPFSGVDGSRMYRTGDLARWLPDGSLEFLGRTDRQVKVRGYRIELGEIEAVVRTFPMVRDCAVIAAPARQRQGWRQGQPGDRTATPAR